MRSLALASLLVAIAPVARADDSSTPSQAAPATALGPVVGMDARVTPDGLDATLYQFRRQLLVRASFRVDGAPGLHALVFDGPPVGMRVYFDGAPVEPELVAPCAPVPTEPRGIDPSTGAPYPLAPAPPRECAQDRVRVTLGPSGRGTLVLETALDPGFDRTRRRRTFPEVAHLHTRREDYLVYHYAVLGPGGPVTFHTPPNTDATWRKEGDLYRFAATEKRKLPIGLTVAIGALFDPNFDLGARVTLDGILPWGDQIVAGADGTYAPGDPSPRMSLSLGYQYFGRWLAFRPFGGHLEASALLDVYPTTRWGARFGIGGHLNYYSTSVLVDVYGSDPSWRVWVVSTLGL